MTSGVFHEGELAVQERAGEAAMADRNSGAIDQRIMRGALPFLRQLPMAVLATRDGEGALWASLVFGLPGFLQSTDGSSLDIVPGAEQIDADDPLWANARVPAQAGLLAIDLATRRRLRANGTLSGEGHQLHLDVDEAFPNCPKYITRRDVRLASTTLMKADGQAAGVLLGPTQAELLRQADVLFLGSAHPVRGADASHRGGPPGFLQVTGNTVRMPDYPGNSMFNTLGNLAVHERAGLTVPDFEHGTLLQMTGRAALRWDVPDPAGISGGTHRFLEFTPERWLQRALPAGIRSELLDYSPYNPPAPSR